MSRAVDLTVTGRVQGVNFRAYAQQEALRLGVGGWVRNAESGAVEAHVEGPDDAVEEFCRWCRDGPPAAQVTDVDVRDGEPAGVSTFEVRH